jgi:hypothetical protein
MKIFTYILLLLMLAGSNKISAQKLILEETDLNNREVAELSFPVDHPSSACVLLINSGLGANMANTRVSSWSKTYFASPGYGGFGGISNSESGLMLRAIGAQGKINFLTGGSPLSFTRMTIDDQGDIGIGTMSPNEKLHLVGGSFYIEGASDGVILNSANGSCWKIIVSNAGALSAVAVACP